MKKIIALLLACILCLAFTGCGKNVKTGSGTAAETAPSSAPAIAAPASESYSPGLPAAKLGDYTITCGDVKNEYDYYVSYMQYYGMTAPTDPDEIAQTVEMIISSAIAEHATAWEAGKEGIELTEAQKADIASQVEAQRTEILAGYSENAAAMLGESATQEEISARALELANADAVEYVGVDFESYLALFEKDLSRAALEEGLRAKYDATVTVTDEDIKAYYDKVLAEDKAAVEENAESFRTMYEDFASGVSGTPALYAPEGFKLVQVLPITMSDADKETYEAGLAEMTTLETEYGHIALAEMTGIDIARMQDISTRYQELKAETSALYAALTQKAEAVYTRATTENITFDALMEDNGIADTGAVLMNTAGDAAFPETVVAAAASMQDGDVNEIISADACYIVRVVSSIPSGEAAFADVKDAVTAGALADRQQAEWESLLSEWETAAGLAAEKFPENYGRITF